MEHESKIVGALVRVAVMLLFASCDRESPGPSHDDLMAEINALPRAKIDSPEQAMAIVRAAARPFVEDPIKGRSDPGGEDDAVPTDWFNTRYLAQYAVFPVRVLCNRADNRCMPAQEGVEDCPVKMVLEGGDVVGRYLLSGPCQRRSISVDGSLYVSTREGGATFDFREYALRFSRPSGGVDVVLSGSVGQIDSRWIADEGDVLAEVRGDLRAKIQGATRSVFSGSWMSRRIKNGAEFTFGYKTIDLEGYLGGEAGLIDGPLQQIVLVGAYTSERLGVGVNGVVQYGVVSDDSSISESAAFEGESATVRIEGLLRRGSYGSCPREPVDGHIVIEADPVVEVILDGRDACDHRVKVVIGSQEYYPCLTESYCDSSLRLTSGGDAYVICTDGSKRLLPAGQPCMAALAEVCSCQLGLGLAQCIESKEGPAVTLIHVLVQELCGLPSGGVCQDFSALGAGFCGGSYGVNIEL